MNSSPTGVSILNYPNAANVRSTDQVLVIYNAISNTSVANGSPSLRLMNVSNFSSNLVLLNATPANSTSNGIAGNFSFDSGYLYICTSNNVWKRAALQSF